MFMPKNKEKQKNCLNFNILLKIEKDLKKCCNYTTYCKYNSKFEVFEF